jgi:ligand-binding sensor domain-containing protein/putative methionine-R-sulfoxide reductase with GAF domain/anti-sigma regulatory factor (Ser/Thr protein kinase)
MVLAKGLFCKKILKRFLLILFILSGVLKTSAQPNILFYQLTTFEGLTDNYIYDMTTDKNGNLWIGTGEGLNMYNGKTVVKYFTSEYPQLRNDYVRQVFCDEKNRIWVITLNGDLTVIDERRRFHRVGLYENNKPVVTRRIFQTATHGMVLFADNAHYKFHPETDVMNSDTLSMNSFAVLPVTNEGSLDIRRFSRVYQYDRDNALFVSDNIFLIANYKTRVVDSIISSAITPVVKWSEDELLVYDQQKFQFQFLDLASRKISNANLNNTDQFGNLLTDKITNAERISKDKILMTSLSSGIYIYNQATNKLYNYRHNAADPTTLINNTYAFPIATDSLGWIFVGTRPNGISYFKEDAVIGQQMFFMDKQGNSYNGYINNLTTLDNDIYYIGASDNLLKWKRSVNTTEFINYGSISGESLVNKEEVEYVTFDHEQRLWVATLDKGIYVLSKEGKPLKHLDVDKTGTNSIPPGRVRNMQIGPDGYMWICGEAGIFRINPSTFEIDLLKNSPLYQLKNLYTYSAFFYDKDNVWIATREQGLWIYNFLTGKVIVHDITNGFLSNDVFCINRDKFNNMYAGTDLGVYIFLQNGKSKVISKKDGLMNNRGEALLLDKQNRMWIENDVGLACFNIADSSLHYFDERYGLSIEGFRIGANHQNNDDELVWGTEKGIQYFYPDDLLRQKINLKTTINRVETRDIVANTVNDESYKLSPADNYVTFYFTTIDYSKHLRTFYEYKLEGVDKDWIKVIDQNSVRYSSLQPGSYIFKVRASNDNNIWEAAGNEITISIATPVLKSWWFRLLATLLAIGAILLVANYFRKKQQRQKEQLETEVVINYFASQINSQKNTGELIWDIAKNCISKLHFEDCVIYLKDEERNILVQKAAYGPKNPVDFTIHKPIEIPVGKGITGTVAQTGIAEIINNTAEDNRYILDDERRSSEIAVPILINHKVVGVIDSEHHEKNFFTARHLQILSTIAALCANQIQKTRAEEEKQRATIELLENKQKATESRLQSLRLQMNPHFLFNALNSVQQMILGNEEMVATKYLSRFSKLLRAILVHSDKETISLKEELDILGLYVELESIRFKDSFQYKILCDETIDADEIKIPTLLVQPFVENAIWHGLMHKEGKRQLKVEFTEEGDFIKCIVEDNGIGREKAAKLKMTTGQDKKHSSKGIEVSKERLKTLRTKDGREGSINIIDLVDENGLACGTKVEINFPIQN